MGNNFLDFLVSFGNQLAGTVLRIFQSRFLYNVGLRKISESVVRRHTYRYNVWAEVLIGP
jgi:hypothetical protein